MNQKTNHSIRPFTLDHLKRYGEIYAAAFSGEPWNDPWKAENAEMHVKELLDSPRAYGLEYVCNGIPAGLLIGNSVMFHSGRILEIHDLAVDPDYQHQGIATKLMEKCLADAEAEKIASVYLTTASEGILPAFYEKFGFKKNNGTAFMDLKLG